MLSQSLHPRHIPVTLGLCFVLVIAFAATGPTLSTRYQDTLPEAITSVLRHGSLSHLAGNILVIFFGGIFAEQRLGMGRFCLLILASAGLGTTLQFTFVGPNFIGASAVAYGLLAYGLIADRPPSTQAIMTGAITLLLGIEWVYLSQQLAIYSHISGAAVGATFVMFEKFFGSKTPTLKPMQASHIARVLEIIAQTDTDDAQEAEEEFQENGFNRMFVLVEKGVVLGVTGYNIDNQVDDVAWLSWTYLSKENLGAGLGSQMMNDLLGMLKNYGVRKIFIATSDYEDFGKKIYAGAHKMYEDFGATVEMTVPDYHNPMEAKIVYGLQNPEFVAQDHIPSSDRSGLLITGIDNEPETDNVVGLRWEETDAGLAGIDHALEMARTKIARMAILALPSDLSEANAVTLEAHNFKKCGMLKEYYNPALHQVWWICSLGTQH